jgi:hypothetical protein
MKLTKKKPRFIDIETVISEIYLFQHNEKWYLTKNGRKLFLNKNMESCVFKT